MGVVEVTLRTFQPLADLLRYRDLLRNLLARDLKVRYKNSALGFLWALLNPLLLTVVFVVVFQILMPTDIPNFPAFILTGILAWNFASSSVMASIHSVVDNGSLIKKVYFPRELLPLSAVLSNLVNFLLALPVLFLLVILYRIPITGYVLWLPVVVVAQTTFLVGLGLFLATVNVFFRDTEAVADVLLLAWFFMTPIFYDVSALWHEWHGINLARLMYIVNPMASFISSYRLALVQASSPDLYFMSRTVVTSLAVLVAGYLFFKVFEGRFGEEL